MNVQSELLALIIVCLESKLVAVNLHGSCAGVKWYHCFIETFPISLRNICKWNRVFVFKFGNGKRISSLKYVILCILMRIRVDINTNIVEFDIQLLLSKSALKKAGTS